MDNSSLSPFPFVAVAVKLTEIIMDALIERGLLPEPVLFTRASMPQ